MMRGIIVVITALMSIAFLGRKLYAHHWWSMLFIVLGVFEVGYVSTFYSTSTGNGSELMGIILLLISQCFTGAQFIIEEKILGNYYLDPFVVVGSEGMWGLVYYLAALTPMQLLTPCGKGYVSNPGVLSAMCNDGYLENSAYGFWQMGSNEWLITQTIISICSIAAFNSFGIATTKYASAAQRSTIDTSRTVLIWILSASFHMQPWELPSLLGFVMLAGGTLVFNEILVIKWGGLDQNTAEARAARQKDAEKEKDQNYVSLSPHAAYDAKRNQRGLEQKGLNATTEVSKVEEEAEAEYMLKTKD